MGTCSSKHDMALCIVFFNPAKSKRMIMNYLYMVNILKQKGFPVFTLELVFPSHEHEILDAIHVHSNSHMFHKERLFRILETKIPKEYTKIAFLDGDIVFKHNNWYSETSRQLDTHDVVQPFKECEWLDLTYSDVMLTRKSIVCMEGPVYDYRFHPGFAWAFRREWYNKVGFFDWAISGSGDTLSAAAWMKKAFPKGFKSLPNSIKEEYTLFLNHPKPRITYIEGTIQHLYHGSRINRQYVDRHALIDIKTHIRNILTFNNDGVYEWKSPLQWNPLFLAYFENRKDDSLSVEHEPPVVTLTS